MVHKFDFLSLLAVFPSSNNSNTYTLFSIDAFLIVLSLIKRGNEKGPPKSSRYIYFICCSARYNRIKGYALESD